jgi:glutathione synthase/RimK-type ligase-like ATP-grasp enzyme
MNTTRINIAVCENENNWHSKFIEALGSAKLEGYQLNYAVVNIGSDDWISALDGYEIVIWKPNHMGAESAAYFKEKIYFLEKHLGKVVIPNFNTVWHFESKVAQKYVFEKFAIPAPRTIATFDYQDALDRLQQFAFPVVFKESTGAGSSNVRLVETCAKAKSILKRIFYKQVVGLEIKKKGNFFGKLSLSYLRLWCEWNNLTPKPKLNQPVAYWQEFIPGNSGDLRITVIGNKYAFGFWRKNRPNDFRASGSGLLDYSTPIPDAVMRYCISISDKLAFDSMAYDVLFFEDDFKIVEMSFGYMDTAIYRAAGYYELVDNKLIFHEGNYWPQEMWVKWAVNCKILKA